MCLQIEIACSVPEETQRVARAAFPKGSLYMKTRDELGTLFEDRQFLDLFPPQGQPAEAPWRLALVTLLQFAEGLTDRQAADAVRSRIDWKYALGLELTDPGFDSSVLCEFRARLVEHGAEDRLFETLLACFRERGLLKIRGKQRTDSTHVLAAVRGLNRHELLGETLRSALNTLSEIAPDWLVGVAPSEWFDRYGKRIENYRLPREKAERDALAVQIGADGFRLMGAAYATAAPEAVRTSQEIEIVRQIWLQQFLRQDGQVRLRSEGEIPKGAQLIRSPYDVEARYSVKRETHWTGYKVHLTESCDEGTPHLITQVLTTPSTTADSDATPLVHEAMKQTDRLPSEHYVDEGYTDAELLVESSQQYGIELIGPVARDGSRQAVENQGFDLTQFTLDFEKQVAACPMGTQSDRWKPTRNARGAIYLRAVFPAAVCQGCEKRPLCTRSESRGRTLYLHPEKEHQALHRQREVQKTPEFRKRYAVRAGIEGTISQGVGAFDLRRSRYIGSAKTHLQNLVTAAAMNLCRIGDWLDGTPLAKTRSSAFARLKPNLTPVPATT